MQFEINEAVACILEDIKKEDDFSWEKLHICIRRNDIPQEFRSIVATMTGNKLCPR